MGIPGTTCHSSAHPRARVCVYTCTRARAHLRGVPELPARLASAMRAKGGPLWTRGKGERIAEPNAPIHGSDSGHGRKKMTGRYLEESLTYSNRPELSRRHTRGYRFLPFLFFLLFFFDKLKGVRSGRGGEGERRRLLFSSGPPYPLRRRVSRFPRDRVVSDRRILYLFLHVSVKYEYLYSEASLYGNLSIKYSLHHRSFETFSLSTREKISFTLI